MTPIRIDDGQYVLKLRQHMFIVTVCPGRIEVLRAGGQHEDGYRTFDAACEHCTALAKGLRKIEALVA